MPHHSFTFRNSWLIKVYKSVELGQLAQILVSSARIRKERFLEELECHLYIKGRARVQESCPVEYRRT